MMRPLIAGNWKMNLDAAASRALADAVKGMLANSQGELAVFPPSCYLSIVAERLAGSDVRWGAQNVHSEANGAFTGEISASMLVDLGCQYTIVGHSERRQIFGETDDQINLKALALLAVGIRPIICVGETLAQREAGQTDVRQQMAGSLAGFTPEQLANTVIAYEPVWAIGTGKTATPAQAQAVHADLRKWLEIRYTGPLASSVRILYGGSVKADNAAELLSQPDINGALVGGASLQPTAFAAIAAAAKG
jgi:triosephosphate isomerase